MGAYTQTLPQRCNSGNRNPYLFAASLGAGVRAVLRPVLEGVACCVGLPSHSNIRNRACRIRIPVQKQQGRSRERPFPVECHLLPRMLPMGRTAGGGHAQSCRREVEARMAGLPSIRERNSLRLCVNFVSLLENCKASLLCGNQATVSRFDDVASCLLSGGTWPVR